MKMAGENENEKIVINEVLCFFASHFGSIPLANIQTVAVNFFTDDEIVKAKMSLHEVCVKLLGDVITRIITHKGANKKKADVEDIAKLMTILDENKVTTVKFLACNLRRVPPIDPGSIDLCFMMESVEEMRKKVESLLLLKQQVGDLQASVNNLAGKGPLTMAHTSGINKVQPALNGNKQVQGGQQRAVVQNGGTNAVGMSHDVNLHVNLPQVGSQENVRSYASAARSKQHTVVGSFNGSDNALPGQLKASSLPRETHVYVGNLDLGSTSDQVKSYVEKRGLRVLKCEIVHSKRFTNTRSLAAHVTVDSRDKEKALLADTWPLDTTIRAWIQPRRRTDWSYQGASSRDDWGDESSWH
jgi:hypothetical protein